MNRILTILILATCIVSCSDNEVDRKGFQVSEILEDEDGRKVVGLNIDSLKLETRPRNVLLTNNPEHRLTPVYKVNYNSKTKETFTGSNNYHSNWKESYGSGNNWNGNFMPGFEAVYGYNFVNVSHYNNITQKENKLFEKRSADKDTLLPCFFKRHAEFRACKSEVLYGFSL